MEKISKDKNVPSAILGGVLFVIIFDLIWLWYSLADHTQIGCIYRTCAAAETKIEQILNTPL